jgi:hypothetical protein
VPSTGWRRAALTGAFFAPLFYLAEAVSLAWYPHEQIKGVPTDRLALSYYLEALSRPWDLAHVAVALPIAMAVGAISAQLGAWLGEIRATTIRPRNPFALRRGSSLRVTDARYPR